MLRPVEECYHCGTLDLFTHEPEAFDQYWTIYECAFCHAEISNITTMFYHVMPNDECHRKEDLDEECLLVIHPPIRE